MIDLKWYKSESATKPYLIDKNISQKYVYLRKNIEEIERKYEMLEETYISYIYDEAIVTKEEYALYEEYLKTIDLEKIRADIDYIALMSDIDLEV